MTGKEQSMEGLCACVKVSSHGWLGFGVKVFWRRREGVADGFSLGFGFFCFVL